MELPNYSELGKMYEMNPAAFWQAQNQMDLAKQFQEQKLQQEREVTRQKELANIFDEQNNPIRLRQAGLTADTTEAELGPKQVKSRISQQTEGLQLDAAQKELISKAKQSDLDQMEISAQQMAYSPNPQIRAQGEALLKMHKDFLKLREQQTFTAGESAKQRAHATSLENLRHKNATERATRLAELKARAGAGNEKLTTDQLRAKYIGLAQQAAQQGDTEAAQMFIDQARYITELRAYERPSPVEGKVNIGETARTGEVITNPPRQAPVPPGQTQPQAPRAAPKLPLAKLKEMYPDKTDAELKAAWKRKYGVDIE